jgi:hypothetical protein
MSQATTIRRSVAATVAVALIVVFALTFRLFSHPSSSTQAGNHQTPTATPQNTLFPSGDLVSLPDFPFAGGFDSTPDGASIVGLGQDEALITYDVTTHTTHTLVPGQQQPQTRISIPTTDGRYILWETGTGETKTVSGGVQVITESETLWVYDAQTHQQSAFKTFHRQPNETTLLTFADPVAIFQSMVLWEKSQENANLATISTELHLTNLATGADQVISANDGGVVAVSWPQLLYGVTDAHGVVTAHLKNLQTGTDQALPILPGGGVASMIAAGRVYGVQVVTHNGETASVNVEELLNVGSPQAHWETVTTLTDVVPGTDNPQDYTFGINNQLIVYEAKGGTKIMGRAHGQSVTVKNAHLTQERWLIMQMYDGSYELFDTTKLP